MLSQVVLVGTASEPGEAGAPVTAVEDATSSVTEAELSVGGGMVVVTLAAPGEVGVSVVEARTGNGVEGAEVATVLVREVDAVGAVLFSG